MAGAAATRLPRDSPTQRSTRGGAETSRPRDRRRRHDDGHVHRRRERRLHGRQGGDDAARRVGRLPRVGGRRDLLLGHGCPLALLRARGRALLRHDDAEHAAHAARDEARPGDDEGVRGRRADGPRDAELDGVFLLRPHPRGDARASLRAGRSPAHLRRHRAGRRLRRSGDPDLRARRRGGRGRTASTRSSSTSSTRT
jgi:hypothetical protein